MVWDNGRLLDAADTTFVVVIYEYCLQGLLTRQSFFRTVESVFCLTTAGFCSAMLGA